MATLAFHTVDVFTNRRFGASDGTVRATIAGNCVPVSRGELKV